jgi:hypothetical protein
VYYRRLHQIRRSKYTHPATDGSAHQYVSWWRAVNARLRISGRGLWHERRRGFSITNLTENDKRRRQFSKARPKQRRTTIAIVFCDMHAICIQTAMERDIITHSDARVDFLKMSIDTTQESWITTNSDARSGKLDLLFLGSRIGQFQVMTDRTAWWEKCLLTKLSPSWEAANCATTQELPSNFKEPEGSSPCSQEPSTGPYPEPVRSIQSIPPHPISVRSILILSTTYVLVFLVVSFLLAFPPKSYMNSSLPPFVLHAPLISSSLSWSF